MYLITKKGNVYKWDYKRFIKNLLYVAAGLFLIITYCIVAKFDYLALTGI